MKKKIFICLLLSFAFVSLLSSIVFAREIEGLNIEDSAILFSNSLRSFNNGIEGEFNLPSVPSVGIINYSTGKFDSGSATWTVIPVTDQDYVYRLNSNINNLSVFKYSDDLSIYYGDLDISNTVFSDFEKGYRYFLRCQNKNLISSVENSLNSISFSGGLYNGGSYLTNVSFANFISNITGFILDHLGLFLTIVISIVLVTVGVIVFKRLSRGR